MFYPQNIFCLLHLYALRNGKGWLTQRILEKPSNSFKLTDENEHIQKSICLRYLPARLSSRRVTLKNLFCVQYRFLNEPIFTIFYFSSKFFVRYLSARLARIFAQKITNRFFGCSKITSKKISSRKFGPDQETKKEKGVPKGGIGKKNEIANFSFLRGLYARRIALTPTT